MIGQERFQEAGFSRRTDPWPLAGPWPLAPGPFLRGTRGMSLIEATIILMVLALLTAVLAPAVGDYINDAKNTKAKEDVEAIGATILRVVRDIGLPCLVTSTTVGGCTKANRVDLLKSSGPDVLAADVAGADFAHTDINNAATFNWDVDDGADADTMENQFVANVPNYATPNESTPTGYTKSGPLVALGWRGGYMSSPIGTDPWGKVYLANTVFLAVATDATSPGTAEGNKAGGWSHDVFVITAGPNGVYDTPIAVDAGNRGTVRAGDDLIYLVAGDTR